MIESFNKQYNTNYICLMLKFIFGPNDTIDIQNSHFTSLDKENIFSKAKKENKVVQLWGTGKPLREVLHVDEVAKVCEFFFEKN